MGAIQTLLTSIVQTSNGRLLQSNGIEASKAQNTIEKNIPLDRM